MPVYNTPEYLLRESLNCVLNLNYKNYEILIIDDGSNDDTKKILEEYKKQCIIIHQDNKGISGSRLTGLKKAKGDYIIFVDSDDLINKNSLQIINDVVQNYHPDVILNDPKRFYKAMDDVKDKNKYFKNGVVNKKEVLEQLCMLHINNIATKYVKRSIYEGMDKAIDTSYINGEDLQQATYVILKSDNFYYIEDDIYYYRKNEVNRNYYSSINFNDINFPVPTYNMIFKDDNHKELLPLYKTYVGNSVIYSGFKICGLIKNEKERKKLLNELNEQEITNIVKKIDAKASIVTTILLFLLTNKLYFLFNLAAILYKLVFGFDKSTYQ